MTAHNAESARTLIGALKRHSDLSPSRTFVTLVDGINRQEMTFADLWADARLVAGALAAQGVPQGVVVIIMLRHGLDLYRTFMGAMMHGAIPSFMPYPTPKQRPDLFWSSHAALFARIEPGAIIVYDEIAEDVRRSAPPGTVVMLASDAVRADKARPEPIMAEPDPGGVAFLQHSSGTTGLKKGVMLTHRAVLKQISSYAPAIKFDGDAVIASWLPLYHDMGLIACFILPMVVGAQVVHLDPFEWVGAPLRLLDEIEANHASHVWTPNFAFNHLVLARAQRRGQLWDLSSLRVLSNCSEPCKAESMERFVECFSDGGMKPAAAQVCYAMAETVFAVTQTPLASAPSIVEVSREGLTDRVVRAPAGAEDAQRVVSCGRPIAEVRVRIINDDGTELPEDAVGEICVTGAGLYEGYYRLPEVTAEKLRDGWHHTGDLGFVRCGELYVTGRKDDLVIVRGRNYYAHDLEAMISDTPGVKPGRTVVFAVDSRSLGTAEVVCLVEIQDGASVAEVRRAAKARVESLSGLVLGRVVAVAAGTLHKTTSGKISRDENRKAYLVGQFANAEPHHA